MTSNGTIEPLIGDPLAVAHPDFIPRSAPAGPALIPWAMVAANYNKHPERCSWPGQTCIHTERKRKKAAHPSTSARIESQKTVIQRSSVKAASPASAGSVRTSTPMTQKPQPHPHHRQYHAASETKRQTIRLQHPNSRALRYKCYCYRSKSTNKLQQLQHRYREAENCAPPQASEASFNAMTARSDLTVTNRFRSRK